uniref:Protogenin n=1 Tax=Nothobranchius rachovii TaxID=451742 RepID=A0A1A8R9Y5_9TELE
MEHSVLSYQPGTTVLTYEEELSGSPNQPTPLQSPCDAEGSSNSEGSHETGDSGRYSHDETELTNLSSGPNSRPPTPTAEDSEDSEASGSAGEPHEESRIHLTELASNRRGSVRSSLPAPLAG